MLAWPTSTTRPARRGGGPEEIHAVWRETVLITRDPACPAHAFEAGWRDRLVPAIASAGAAEPGLRRLVVGIPPVTVEPEVAAVFPPMFDGLIEFWFDTPDDAVRTLDTLSRNPELRRLATGLVLPEHGVAWLARVVPVKPGQGATVKFLAGGDVAEGLTLEDAHRYWSEQHPLVAQTAPDVWNRLARYTQFHGTRAPMPALNGWLARERFVPMCSDMGFAQQSDFVALYTSEQYRTIVRPDEERFSRPGEMLAFISGRETVPLDRTSA